MRLLLLSDTHGRLHPEILALAGSVDRVVHAGDVGHPDVLTALTAACPDVIAVRGNNDVPAKWPTESRAILDALPAQAEVALPGGRLRIEHGHRANPVARRHDLLRSRHCEARLVLYGHSHRQVIDRSATPWIVNPGAAGRSRTYGGPGCVLLTATRRRWSLEAFRFTL